RDLPQAAQVGIGDLRNVDARLVATGGERLQHLLDAPRVGIERPPGAAPGAGPTSDLVARHRSPPTQSVAPAAPADQSTATARFHPRPAPRSPRGGGPPAPARATRGPARARA